MKIEKYIDKMKEYAENNSFEFNYNSRIAEMSLLKHCFRILLFRNHKMTRIAISRIENKYFGVKIDHSNIVNTLDGFFHDPLYYRNYINKIFGEDLLITEDIMTPTELINEVKRLNKQIDKYKQIIEDIQNAITHRP